MVIIDFSETKKQAFVRGFQKGLAAPVMLFGDFKAPQTPEVKQITVPSISDKESLNSDWEKIGGDFNRVISRYVETNNT